LKPSEWNVGLGPVCTISFSYENGMGLLSYENGRVNTAVCSNEIVFVCRIGRQFSADGRPKRRYENGIV